MAMKTDYSRNTAEEKPVYPEINLSVPISNKPQVTLFRPPEYPAPLILRNLLNDLDTLAVNLQATVDQADWLNAFLLAAGIWQIVEDYLHSDPLSLQRAEKVFEDFKHPVVSLPRFSIKLVRKYETYAFRRQAHFRGILRWNKAWADLVQALADLTVQEQPFTADSLAHLRYLSMSLLGEIKYFSPDLRKRILKLPNCFRSFDQKPDDVAQLANKFAEQIPNSNQAVVVVGLRTSGSYLAPLFKSYLKQKGYQDVSVTTLRPGIGYLRDEMGSVSRGIKRAAIFTPIDDPPVSGKSFREAAQYLEQAGVPSEKIVLAIPLHKGANTLPDRLKSYQLITLAYEEWAIHQHLTPQAVQATLSGWLLPGYGLSHIEQIPLIENGTDRGHVTGLYRVTITNQDTGQTYHREIFVKGTGLGYLGDQVQDIAQQLSGYFPPIYGFRDGLLFREWAAEENQLSRLAATDLPAAARSMASYLWERHQKLAIPEDFSLRRFGEFPAWEVASNLVSQVFGKAQKFIRVPLVDAVMRQLLEAKSPSIVDGNMALSNWFYPSAEGQVEKVAFERSCFRNDIEYTSYDPVYDLASLAADLDLAVIEGKIWAGQIYAAIRPFYEALSGEKIDEERWLLYQLVRLWETRRNNPATEEHLVRRASSRALQRYFAAHYFADLPTNPAGELCAFDLDGVLETEYLGFPALSPASAASLRLLAQQGYRSILVTGRSLSEVVERCSLYPVAGGVAEYGAVLYQRAEQKIKGLLSEEELGALASLRRQIETHPTYLLDPDYQYAVRVSQLNEKGARVGLTPEQINRLLESCPCEATPIRAIPGQGQTDFMVERVDKSLGVGALLRELGDMPGGVVHEDGRPLALAVGDSLPDLPMLKMAQQAAVPAHADQRLRGPGIKRYSKAYQAGLAMAVTDFLKHAPADLELPKSARTLMPLFAVQENGTKSMVGSIIRQARQFLRTAS